MRLLHYLEIENFKQFGEKQRIELDHPAVLIGPNNCGKTSAVQALALWSQAVKTWYDAKKDSSAKERTAAPINRLNIVAVPVQRTRFFWHDMNVRADRNDIHIVITVGVEFRGKVHELSMRFRNQGDELVYCSPSEEAIGNPELLAHAASLSVNLLYPMSGLDIEEPILQPGRIDVLLGQGRTAEVLRNLCYIVHTKDAEDWKKIVSWMERLFGVRLQTPAETARGSILLEYQQAGMKQNLDISSSGRGFQQMLLIFAYLFSHKNSVFLIDEPDAHLEILRQKQIYILLRDVASQNRCQVVMVTHSEVILDEAMENNLTLLLDGKADNIAKRQDIRNSLKHFGADHYIKARERGYVLYVEGSTDVDMLRGLAERIDHPVTKCWDERINTFYVQDNYPDADAESELERVEGGFGLTPEQHFNGLRNLIPKLKGLAILDNDGKERKERTGDLTILYWKRYELENYFITPWVLLEYVVNEYDDLVLFGGHRQEAEQILDALILEKIFDNEADDFSVWKKMERQTAKMMWQAKTERRKLSIFAEEFFRRLAAKLGTPMLLRKGELHLLLQFVDAAAIPSEVREKLNSLETIFRQAGGVAPN
ncbi:MAG: AAA family ATPase [Deltaproteobacteria bacterium]|nr:AAA family ATPase [Deltaproteobacteria bacterium]